MKQCVKVFGTMLFASTLGSPALASAQHAPDRLRPDEYETVALIFNEELAQLGNRALYPICISTPSDTPLKPLLRYLRRGGYPISDLSLCVPNIGRDGKHAKDYPHGLRISLGKPQRGPVGQISLQVESGDLTLRPGEHFGLTLRQGIYHFKQAKNREWQISDYTKEYDFKDQKAGHNCDVAKPAAPTC